MYELTKDFPESEKFGMTSQLRRASVSIPANIAEGYRRFSNKDKLKFFNYSQTSLDECGYYLLLAKDLNYVQDIKIFENQIELINKLLNSYVAKILENTKKN